MLAYHQVRGRLGMGDLHPGGAPATARILQLLGERRARRVLEVGAGIGNTTLRMLALGWDVTALEPDPVLFRLLEARVGSRARREPLAAHRVEVPYDAVLAESVLSQLDLAAALRQAAALLAPGGSLAFVEAVWTDAVSPVQSREWHERTRELFGIPVGSRERLVWPDWRRALEQSGFETLHAERLPRDSAGHPPTSSRQATTLALLRDPRLAASVLRYRARKRRARMPAGALESWIFIGRRPLERSS